MQLTFLGTGGAQQVPVFGCDCPICQRRGASRHFGGERAAPCLTIRGNDLIGCGIAGFGAAIFGGANSTFFTDTLPHGSRSGVISFALGVRKFHSGVWPAG